MSDDDRQTASPSGAMDYYLGQLWDAARGLLTAYEVDTGDVRTAMPSWDRATAEQRAMWTAVVGPDGARQTYIAFAAISGLGSKS